MCPLRVILIFLSATIAGFFLIRGLNADPDLHDDADASESPRERPPVPLHSKVIKPKKGEKKPFFLGRSILFLG
jgi:hypothetical protein